jgi:hypothetical protein
LEKAEPARRLVVSFHDLHPGSRDVCARFLEQLAGRGVTRASLLVVPRWHGAAAFTGDAAFTRWLKDRAAEGHDICLHGWFHRAGPAPGNAWQRLVSTRYTAGEGEFYRIDRETARERIRDGIAMLAGEAGLPVFGFTPPAWLLSDAGRTALVEAGLSYSTTLGRVDLLRRGASVPAPTIVYSCRSAWRRLVSRLWVRLWATVNADAPVLRIAAHPIDFTHAKIEASLLHRIDRALASGRTPATYRDMLPPDATPVPVGPLVAA